MMDKAIDFLDALVEQLSQDDRLVDRLAPRLLERLGTNAASKNDRWLSVNEAADYLNVSTDLIYLMVREGTLKASRLGALSSRKPAIRFQKSQLDAWMEAGGVRV